jgi:hypothetical protein
MRLGEAPGPTRIASFTTKGNTSISQVSSFAPLIIIKYYINHIWCPSVFSKTTIISKLNGEFGILKKSNFKNKNEISELLFWKTAKQVKSNIKYKILIDLTKWKVQFYIYYVTTPTYIDEDLLLADDWDQLFIICR